MPNWKKLIVSGSDASLNSLTTTNQVVVNSTTQSTSKTTGALLVSGGVGIAKTLSVGEDVIAFSSSDERLKTNIIPITDPINKIKKIGGYEFDWVPKKDIHENKGHDVGVIAQEIEKVLPEVVTTRDNGYKAVKYDKIVALLIEGIKEQQLQIEDLKAQLNEKN